jgi:hypothetical protein
VVPSGEHHLVVYTKDGDLVPDNPNVDPFDANCDAAKSDVPGALWLAGPIAASTRQTRVAG